MPQSRPRKREKNGDNRIAYIEPLAVDDTMRDMPLFLARGFYVAVPLESTYQATWNVTPEVMRQAVETGKLPDVDADQRPFHYPPDMTCNGATTV